LYVARPDGSMTAEFESTLRLMISLALTGKKGSRTAEIADQVMRVPTRRTKSSQGLHIVIGHMLCDIVKGRLC
jgi:D-arabinose 5-phosphate isomerase GutQ